MQAANLNWSDDYLIGVDVIDEQHKRLFAYFAEVEAMTSSGQTGGLERVLHGLIDYAVTHNSFEESLMEKAGYSMLSEHQDSHEAFRCKVQDYRQRLDKGEDPIRLAREVRSYIGLWLINHIQREDQLYAACVKKNMDAGLVRKLLARFF